jgi:hypothetical protein
MEKRRKSGMQWRWPNWGHRPKNANDYDRSEHTMACSVYDEDDSSAEPMEASGDANANEKRDSLVQTILDDFRPDKGDQKILRAIGRTASVNAAVLLTAATGGAAAAAGVGFGVGGAITAKRAADGIVQKDEKEVVKSLSVYGAATGASIGAQAITAAILLGCGAALPVAAAVAFGAGCASGITAGALSEWTVDGVIDKINKKKTEGSSNRERGESDGTLPTKPKDVSNVQLSKNSHRRSRSDTVIVDFDKWYQQRNAPARRNSCIF